MGALLPSTAGREGDFGNRRVTLERISLSCLLPNNRLPPQRWAAQRALLRKESVNNDYGSSMNDRQVFYDLLNSLPAIQRQVN